MGMGNGRSGQQIEAGIIIDDVALHHATMAVVSVLTEADIGDDDQFRLAVFDGFDRPLDDAVAGIGAGGQLILLVGNTEQQNRRYAELGGLPSAGQEPPR